LVEIKLSGRRESANSVPVSFVETFPFAKAVYLDLEIPTSKAKTITIQRATRVIVAVVETPIRKRGHYGRCLLSGDSGKDVVDPPSLAFISLPAGRQGLILLLLLAFPPLGTSGLPENVNLPYDRRLRFSPRS